MKFAKDSRITGRGQLTASLVVVSAMFAAVDAADLVVAAGDSQTISANATYDTITVGGSLTIDSAATVNATMVYVGHDGATGLVTVTGGATLTVPTTTDQGMFLGSITAGSSTTPGQGRLVIENGSVEGRLYFSQNCISNGTTKTTSPTNELWLGEGGVCKGIITHYGDPSLRIAFAGGHAINPSGNSRSRISETIRMSRLSPASISAASVISFGRACRKPIGIPST